MGTGKEATRGDYEYNPTGRSVAKSAHSVRLRSDAGKGKMSKWESDASIPFETDADGALRDRDMAIQRGGGAANEMSLRVERAG